MTDVLTVLQVKVPGTARSKDDAVREAGGILVASGAVTDDYIDAMFERETSVSTYMGNYLAIPHGTNEAKASITRSALSVVRYDPPIDWDGNEVRFVVGIAGHEGGPWRDPGPGRDRLLRHRRVDRLVAAGSADEVYAILSAVNED